MNYKQEVTSPITKPNQYTEDYAFDHDEDEFHIRLYDLEEKPQLTIGRRASKQLYDYLGLSTSVRKQRHYNKTNSLDIIVVDSLKTTYQVEESTEFVDFDSTKIASDIKISFETLCKNILPYINDDIKFNKKMNGFWSDDILYKVELEDPKYNDGKTLKINKTSIHNTRYRIDDMRNQSKVMPKTFVEVDKEFVYNLLKTNFEIVAQDFCSRLPEHQKREMMLSEILD